MVSALGVVQIFAWGSTFYLLSVLADPMIAETGWSRSLVMGGISLALAASGGASILVGRLIGEYGGRPVLTGGMALLAVGLAVLSVAHNAAVYLVGWLIIGLGMGAGLYDAAFATLG